MTVELKQYGNLLVEHRPLSGCWYHRIGEPLKAFGEDLPDPKNTTIWFSRLSAIPYEKLKEYKLAGVKIWIDQDDHFILSSKHVLKETYRVNGMAERFKDLLDLADVVTVTNDFLAKELSPYTKGEVVVVPNALTYDEGQFTKSADIESGTPLVYVGGNTHLHDLELVRKALPINGLTIGGVSQDCAVWQEVTKRFKGVSTKPQQSLDNYMSLYDGHKIALAPLEKNNFNMCKSNLKVLEAAAKGLPIVCSKTLPYYNNIDKDVVIFGNSENSWRSAVTKLLKDEVYRQDKAEQLAEHCRTHYQMKDANEIRRQIIESL